MKTRKREEHPNGCARMFLRRKGFPAVCATARRRERPRRKANPTGRARASLRRGALSAERRRALPGEILPIESVRTRRRRKLKGGACLTGRARKRRQRRVPALWKRPKRPPEPAPKRKPLGRVEAVQRKRVNQAGAALQRRIAGRSSVGWQKKRTGRSRALREIRSFVCRKNGQGTASRVRLCVCRRSGVYVRGR